MSKPILTRVAIVAGAGVALAGSFYAGAAYAADQRLDQANGHVNQAIVLLQAAENPGVKPPFGGHRAKAVRLLKRAQRQIEKAKKWADNPPKRAKKRGSKKKK